MTAPSDYMKPTNIKENAGKTFMEYIPAKTIVSGYSGGSSWFGANYNMNIYKGCCHGCIYCDSRSECYGINDFDTIKAKENALMIIRNDLRRKVKTGVVAAGSMSDPYNPFEKELLLTRRALELINAFGFGAAIATKSVLVTRDIDILNDIKEHSPVLVKITVTAADDALSAKVEPGAPLSSERFEAVRRLSESGIFAGILMMPILPFIEDTEENILGIIEKARSAGARFIYPSFGMTLRQNQREWYFEKLNEIFPQRRLPEKYISRFGAGYSCSSPHAKDLWNIFRNKCHECGILYDMKEIISASRLGYGGVQLSFFEN